MFVGLLQHLDSPCKTFLQLIRILKAELKFLSLREWEKIRQVF